jgi:hypothetical protein
LLRQRSMNPALGTDRAKRQTGDDHHRLSSVEVEDICIYSLSRTLSTHPDPIHIVPQRHSGSDVGQASLCPIRRMWNEHSTYVLSCVKRSMHARCWNGGPGCCPAMGQNGDEVFKSATPLRYASPHICFYLCNKAYPKQQCDGESIPFVIGLHSVSPGADVDVGRPL